MSKKMRNADDYIKHIYVHLNELSQFVLFSGLSFQEFISSVGQLDHLLLLKTLPTDEETSFNMHTRLNFVEQMDVPKFAKIRGERNGDLCWIDFESEKKLNLLTPQEQAELLYIGHKKEPIRSPFYHQLQNRFVYLETADEKMTRIYARDLEEMYAFILNFFNKAIQAKERATSFWRRRPLSETPTFDEKCYAQFLEELHDGALLSVYRAEKPQLHYVLEVRNVAEINYPDEIWDDLNSILQQAPNKILKTTKK